MSNKVVTRFAPSPTGFIHVGNLRTALYAYLWARKNNGTFILRIEDTDKEREVLGSVGHIIEVLNWVGIEWDEGPDAEGPNSPYYQSERLELYKKYAHKLIDKGLAYPDPFTEEQVDEFREKAELAGKPFLFREYRPETFEEWDGTKPLRLKVPEVKSYHWNDLVYGNLSAGPEALDDFILIKSDGYPTYNFAHIIDDLEMEVTHVMRGQEFISSVPKFLSLYEALDIEPPIFATLPPIMAPDGKKKLGKRDGAKDVLDYKKEGYLPHAMVNFLALLGWHPSRDENGVEKEIFTINELIEAFDLSRVQNSGAKWDEVKLDWMNKEHIKKLSKEKIEEDILKWLPEDMRNPKIVPLILERISKFSDVREMLDKGELYFFFDLPNYPKEKLIFKDAKPEDISTNIKMAISALETLEEKDFTKENIKDVLMEKANGLKSKGELLHPVRFALSGLDKSPDPFVIAEILGKNETLARLQKAV